MKSWRKNNVAPATLTSLQVAQEVAGLNSLVAKGVELTSKNFKSAIYAAQDVKVQLIRDQHAKCAYCETSLLPIACGEVEHYRPKTGYSQQRGKSYKPAYYWLAYEWKNLMAACPACNRKKGTFFPLMTAKARDIIHQNIQNEDPLILNPYVDIVEEHLEYRMYKIFPKTNPDGSEDIRGRVTIDEVELNRSDLEEARRRVWFDFQFERQGMTYADGLKRTESKMNASGLTKDDVQYQNMFYNQIIRI